MPPPPAARLSAAAVEAALSQLPGWSASTVGAGAPAAASGLHREYVFASFSAAWGWMSRVALLAEARDHHPEWRNVHARVAVRLTTHDAGGITDRDVIFARTIEGYFGELTGAAAAAAAAAAPAPAPPLR